MLSVRALRSVPSKGRRVAAVYPVDVSVHNTLSYSLTSTVQIHYTNTRYYSQCGVSYHHVSLRLHNVVLYSYGNP